MHETDELIYSRYLRKGSEDDLKILLERHRESLTLFLFGFVQSEEDAEELMMDTYAVVASGTAGFSGKSTFKTWLFAIGRNKARSLLRRRKGFFVSMDDVQITDHETPELSILDGEQSSHLYEAMEHLPTAYKQVLYLIYFEEMTHDEICGIMHKSKKQVYNLAERGKKALREEMTKKGYQYEKHR